MEQKLYYLEMNVSSGREIEFPKNLQALLNDGWVIQQISAYGFAQNASYEACALLLQREKK